MGTIAAESLSPFLLFIAHPTVLKSPFYSKSSFTDTGIPCRNGREFYVSSFMAFLRCSSQIFAFSIALSKSSSVVKNNYLPKVWHLCPKKLTRSTDVNLCSKSPYLN